jgi:hypothetical protein
MLAKHSSQCLQLLITIAAHTTVNMPNRTWPSMLLYDLIDDGTSTQTALIQCMTLSTLVDHELKPQAIELSHRLGVIADQLHNRFRIHDRWVARLHLVDSQPHTTVARRARLERRTEGALRQIEELTNRLVVLEMLALDLLLDADYVEEWEGGFLSRDDVPLVLL